MVSAAFWATASGDSRVVGPLPLFMREPSRRLADWAVELNSEVSPAKRPCKSRDEDFNQKLLGDLLIGSMTALHPRKVQKKTLLYIAAGFAFKSRSFRHYNMTSCNLACQCICETSQSSTSEICIFSTGKPVRDWCYESRQLVQCDNYGHVTVAHRHLSKNVLLLLHTLYRHLPSGCLGLQLLYTSCLGLNCC